MLADRGYDSDSFRQDLLLRGTLPVIPSCKGRSAPQKTDWRRVATRYDKTALSFMSFLNLAAAKLWIRPFVNAT